MFSFEKLHRNHKLAFLDGFLCGVLAIFMAAHALEDRIVSRNTSEDPVKIPNQRKATPAS